MARKSSGMAVLDVAKEILRTTKSVDELRITQAVIFPLEKGMTIAETATCIGRSVRWTTEHRMAFIKAHPIFPLPIQAIVLLITLL